ncbi:MAG: T9SS type A sorting domain-containing protein [Bacteroidota bacterium]
MEFDLDLITNFRGEDILRYRANNGLTGTTSFEFTISDGFDFAETSRKVIINVLKPQFEASYKGVLLNDRVRFDLKDVPVGASLPITFQIENVGTSSLRLRDLPLQVTNNNIDQYEILQQPDKSVLEPGETTEFIVAFQPTSTGNKNNARIILLNSDFDSNDKDFRIDLFGRGVNDETAPAFLSDPEVSVAENLKSVYQIETNEWVTFSLGSEKDESFFELESNTIDTLKKLSFVTPPDFENPNDGNQDNVYQLDVSATDLAGLSTMFELTVTVTDVANEGIVITSPSMISVDENVTGSIYVATANVPATFSLGNSKDESLFSIVNAEISFNSSPNFEDPLDVDTNNIYLLDLIARANDGSTAVTELAVAVNDVEEVISSTRQWLENSEKEWILPNPATYTFSLNGFERAEYQQVSIYDFSGKELISYKDLSSNSFDISSLDQGVYLVIAAGLNDILPLGRLIKK